MDDDESPPLLVDADGNVGEREIRSGVDIEESKISRVPISIITGYLGAGKTTLMNYILSARHGKKIAVILNEFGNSSDIEKSLTINQGDQQVEEWLELANGCICCSVKDQGVNAIESLMEKRGAFDYILLETTGLADPGNIAPIFWVDEGLGSSIYLDGIVTLVDAKNILRSLDQPVGDETVHSDHHESQLMSTAHLQISHADVIVLNKSDLVSEAELRKVEERVRSINALAKLRVTRFSQIPQLEGLVLDLHAYDSVAVDNLDFASKGHSHLDPAIATITLTLPALTNDELARLDEWLRSVLWDARLPLVEIGIGAFEIHRIKGRLVLQDGRTKMLQGVREIFELIDGPEVAATSTEAVSIESKVVIIGRNVGEASVETAFLQSITESVTGRPP